MGKRTFTDITSEGKEWKARLQGSYFDLGRLGRGATARIEFPDRTTRKTERVGEVEFTTVWPAMRW